MTNTTKKTKQNKIKARNKLQHPSKCLMLIGKAQLRCLGIGRNADDWAVVSVSALYGASAAAYAGKTRLMNVGLDF